MTGADVQNIGSSGGGAAITQTAPAQKKNTAENAGAVFSSFMNQTANSLGNQSNDNSFSGVSDSSKAQAYDRYQYRDNSVEKAQTATISDKIDVAKDELEEFGEQVTELIGNKFGADEEQVEEVLDALGLTVFDLLNPQNLAAVVQELTGADNPAELLLNADFQEVLGEIGQMGSNLMNRLSLDMNQMDELVSQMDEMFSAESMPKQTESEEAQQAFDAEDVITNPQEEQAIQSVTAGKDAAEGMDTENEELPDVKESTVTIVDERTKPQQTADRSFGGQTPGGHMAEHNPAMAESPLADVPVAESAENISYSSIDALDLIEQIAENVKVVLANDSTSMEMQLNPESLGKIYLNVSAKEGAVNAQIAAQNEAVKAALEAQIATLRENLNQAGIKVDAIEVTVASHEFESNLEQNQHGNGKQEETEGSSARKNIRMDSLDELAGLMTEEEALVAQIMKDNGNSVDFTA